jgi:hypothetical protein
MKEKLKLTACLVSSILLAIMTAVPVTAGESQGLAKGKGDLPPFLRGNYIDIYWAYKNDVFEITLPANEPCFTCHGQLYEDWADRTSGERKSFQKEGTRFELSIDGEDVELRKWMHHYAELYHTVDEITLYDVKTKLYYIQLGPNSYTPGQTVVFVGTWYWDGANMGSLTLTVHFD